MSSLPAHHAKAENGWFDKMSSHYDELAFKKKKGAKNLCG